MIDEIIVNGKRFVGSKGHLYEISTDGKKTRVSKYYFDEQCKEEVMKTTINTKIKEQDMKLNTTEGHSMSYQQKVQQYGVDIKWINKRFGNVAYKPAWNINGREMSGEFLVIHEGKPMMIRELMFKGNMIVNELKNFKLLGLFQDWDKLITNVKTIGEFNSKGRSDSKDDETDFDSQFDMALSQDKDLIEVLKFNLGSIELVGFINTHTGHLFGVRPYSVYDAETKLRNKPKDMNEAFEEALNKDINSNELYRTKTFEEVAYTANTVSSDPF